MCHPAPSRVLLMKNNVKIWITCTALFKSSTARPVHSESCAHSRSTSHSLAKSFDLAAIIRTSGICNWMFHIATPTHHHHCRVLLLRLQASGAGILAFPAVILGNGGRLRACFVSALFAYNLLLLMIAGRRWGARLGSAHVGACLKVYGGDFVPYRVAFIRDLQIAFYNI